IEPEAPRHHRVAIKVAVEEPEILPDVELGPDLPLAVGTTILGNARYPIEHQHRRQRQLRVARAEQLAAGTGQQVLVAETGFSSCNIHCEASLSVVITSDRPHCGSGGICASYHTAARS